MTDVKQTQNFHFWFQHILLYSSILYQWTEQEFCQLTRFSLPYFIFMQIQYAYNMYVYVLW